MGVRSRFDATTGANIFNSCFQIGGSATGIGGEKIGVAVFVATTVGFPKRDASALFVTTTFVLFGEEFANITGDTVFYNFSLNTFDGELIDFTGFNHAPNIFTHKHWSAGALAGFVHVTTTASVVIGGADLLVVGNKIGVAFKFVFFKRTDGFLEKFPF